MFRMVSALIAAVAIAAALIMVPGVSDTAHAKRVAKKGNRLDLTVRLASCRQMAWPYYDQNCRKDHRRPVRLVTTDRR
jgi:hypothetical protein